VVARAREALRALLLLGGRIHRFHQAAGSREEQ
jgi:hypothetical protein